MLTQIIAAALSPTDIGISPSDMPESEATTAGCRSGRTCAMHAMRPGIHTARGSSESDSPPAKRKAVHHGKKKRVGAAK
eukprot:365990-Chlamydomonas_euryale.AAC.22